MHDPVERILIIYYYYPVSEFNVTTQGICPFQQNNCVSRVKHNNCIQFKQILYNWPRGNKTIFMLNSTEQYSEPL